MTLELQIDPAGPVAAATGTLEMPVKQDSVSQLDPSAQAKTTSDCFRIEKQRSVGPDGVAYAATDVRADESVELWKLGSDHSAERRAEVQRRLRLVGLLRNSAARQIRESFRDGEQRIVVLEPAGLQSLTDWQLTEASGLGELKLLQAIVQLLAEAHQLGLTHEQLHPDAIRVRADGSPQIHFTRLQADAGMKSKVAGQFLAAEDIPYSNSDPTSDVYSLGQLVEWCFEFRPELEEACHKASARHTAELKQLAQSSIFDPPEDRPTLSRYLDCLTAFVDSAAQQGPQGTVELPPPNLEGDESTNDTTNELDANFASTDSTAEIASPAVVGDSTADMGLLGPVPT